MLRWSTRRPLPRRLQLLPHHRPRPLRRTLHRPHPHPRRHRPRRHPQPSWSCWPSQQGITQSAREPRTAVETRKDVLLGRRGFIALLGRRFGLVRSLSLATGGFRFRGGFRLGLGGLFVVLVIVIGFLIVVLLVVILLIVGLVVLVLLLVVIVIILIIVLFGGLGVRLLGLGLLAGRLGLVGLFRVGFMLRRATMGSYSYYQPQLRLRGLITRRSQEEGGGAKPTYPFSGSFLLPLSFS